jgi:hypothetical protein
MHIKKIRVFNMLLGVLHDTIALKDLVAAVLLHSSLIVVQINTVKLKPINGLSH